LGSNRVDVEGPGNAHVRRKVDECLDDLLWGDLFVTQALDFLRA